jgi:hypothetical protein
MFPSAFIICHGYGLFLQFILSSIFLYNTKSHATESPLFWNNLKLKSFKWKHWQYQRNILWKRNALWHNLCHTDVQKSDKYTKYSSIVSIFVIKSYFCVYQHWFKLMLDKNIYSYWYVGQNLNYYNDEKDATVTNPSLKVLKHTLF